MPIEIRELVIQAKVTNENNSEKPLDNLSQINQESVEELIQNCVGSSLADTENKIKKEIKSWLKDYLEQRERRF